LEDVATQRNGQQVKQEVVLVSKAAEPVNGINKVKVIADFVNGNDF
jgi:hypothetical protein